MTIKKHNTTKQDVYKYNKQLFKLSKQTTKYRNILIENKALKIYLIFLDTNFNEIEETQVRFCPT